MVDGLGSNFGKTEVGVTFDAIEANVARDHHPRLRQPPLVPMDTPAWMLLTLALVMAGVAWHARRPGDERRGIAVLGTVAALLAIGSAAAVVF
jgi:hypothetical protein